MPASIIIARPERTEPISSFTIPSERRSRSTSNRRTHKVVNYVKTQQVFRPERPLQYLAKGNFKPKYRNELQLRKDEMYTMIDEGENARGNARGWCLVENVYGRPGYVPFDYLRVMPGVPWRAADPPPSYESLFPMGPPSFIDEGTRFSVSTEESTRLRSMFPEEDIARNELS